MSRELYERMSVKELISRAMCGDALWGYVEGYDICLDDYRIIDRGYNYGTDNDLPEGYEWSDGGIILKELYTYTEDSWVKKDVIA
jgi:hypothetical protein